MAELTHFNEEGRARMVDVGGKEITRRTAVAEGCVRVNGDTLAAIRSGGMKKGDVLAAAQIGGIMAAKKTWELIPMCHTVRITGIDLRFHLNDEDNCVEILAEVHAADGTGVEMEALTAVSAAALTIYDMCKGMQKDMVIEKIRLLKKTGGKSGDFSAEQRKWECENLSPEAMKAEGL